MDKIEALREHQEELTKVRRLIDEPGFKWFQNICSTQVQNRLTDIVLAPPEGLDDMVKKIYAIGECAGLRLALNLPEIHKEQLEYDIKLASKGNEDE